MSIPRLKIDTLWLSAAVLVSKASGTPGVDYVALTLCASPGSFGVFQVPLVLINIILFFSRKLCYRISVQIKSFLSQSSPISYIEGDIRPPSKMKPISLSRPLALFTVTIALLVQTSCALFIPITTNLTADTHHNLAKRGCFVSKEETGNIPLCTTLSVDYFKNIINQHNYLPQRDCLFYLGLGGAAGQVPARQWYCSKRSYGRGAVVWENALPSAFMSSLFIELSGKQGPSIRDSSQQADLFTIAARLISQVMGETCNGEVYVLAPQSNDGTDPPDNVWILYEYPALTRNSQVRSILKVDPTIKTSSGEFADDGIIMWTPANGPSPNPPAGNGYHYDYADES